jgi:hypothetical protein
MRVNKKSEVVYGLIALFIIVLILTFSRKAHADDYGVFTCCSWHAVAHDLGPEDHNSNEKNFGLGFERTLNSDWTFTMGEYHNSLYKHTNYIGFLYQPLHFGNFKFGTVLGDVTGYGGGKLGKLGAVPMLTWTAPSGAYGVNIMMAVAPPLTQHLWEMDQRHSEFALQFKVRIP